MRFILKIKLTKSIFGTVNIPEMNVEILNELREYLSDKNCELIAVTKTHPVNVLEEAYKLNLRHFGENKAQEMAEKYAFLPKDINWHMIGHLQSNKVKYIAPFVTLIHSVDSMSLLQEINKQAVKNNRLINCLIQIYIAQEETKFGLNEVEAKELLANAVTLTNVKIIGLMGMASNTSDTQKVREEFKYLKGLFDSFKTSNPDFSILSMGMSGDYKMAVEEGSTMIRVGSAIFGSR